MARSAWGAVEGRSWLHYGDVGIVNFQVIGGPTFGVAEGGVGFVELLKFPFGDLGGKAGGVGVIAFAEFAVGLANFDDGGGGVQAEEAIVVFTDGGEAIVQVLGVGLGAMLCHGAERVGWGLPILPDLSSIQKCLLMIS